MNRNSTLWLALFFGVVLAVSACSDDGGDGGGGGGGTDLGADISGDGGDTPDSGGDTGGNRCGTATPCTGNQECTREEYCDDGCCRARDIPETCSQAGQECSGPSWSTLNFVCSMPEGGGVGECLERCETDGPLSTDDHGCPTGLWCLDSGDPVVNEAAGAYLDGACVPGDCNDSCFAVAGDCTESDLYTCSDGAGTCYAIGNDASFCIEAGTQAEGEDCNATSLSGEPGTLCAAGRMCYNGTCVAPCVYGTDTKAAVCTDGECLPVFDHTGDNTPGVCGDECTAFSDGECAEGFACTWNIGFFSGSVTGWACSELSSDTLAGNGEECDPDGATSTCGEGLWCIPTIEDDAVGTCQQVCDPLLTGDQTFSNCAPGSNLPLLAETYVAPGAGTDLQTITAASYNDLQAVAEPVGDAAGELFGSTATEFVAGTSSTVIAYIATYTAGEPDPTLTYGLFAQTDVYADDAPLGTDKASIWLTNLSDAAIDILSMLEVPTEDPGVAPSWFDVPNDFAAQGVQEVWNAFTLPEVSEGVFFDTYEVILTGADPDYDVIWVGNDFTAPTGDNALIRVINASGIDMWIEAGELGIGVDRDAIADGAVVEYTIDAVADLTGGDLNIVFSDAATAGNLTSWDSAVAVTTIVTIVLWSDAGDSDAVKTVDFLGDAPDTAAAEGDVSIRTTNASAAAADFWLGELYVDALASMDTYMSGDIDPGTMDVVVFSDAAVSGDSAVTTADITTEANKVWEGGLYLDDAGELGIGGGNGDWPGVATLGEGDALAKLVNLTDVALRLEYPGPSSEVCVDLGLYGLEAGALGRCEMACDPFVDGAFANDDGSSTGRWENNGCEHTDTRSYACIPVLTPYDNSVAHQPEGPPDIAGACAPRPAASATGKFGAACTGDAVCNPDAFCVGHSDTESFCDKLGRPFSTDEETDCGDQYCLATTNQWICICVDAASDAKEGEACLPQDEFYMCSDHNTICMETSPGGFSCVRLCSMGDPQGSCPNHPPECGRDRFNHSIQWLGLCI